MNIRISSAIRAALPAALLFLTLTGCAPYAWRQSALISSAKKGAASGDLASAIRLAVMYETGALVRKDPKRAAHWHLQAAEAGDPESQRVVALLYREGRGLEKSETSAARWMLAAARQGDLLAQREMGLFYKKGEGIRKDMKKALFWLRKASEGGEAEAQYALGAIYDEGLDGSRDPSRAYIWFALAALNGKGGALWRDHLRARDRIARELSPIEFVRAAHKVRTLWRNQRARKRNKEGA